MGRKMLFVYNPHAGKAAIKSKLSDIIEIFVGAGFDVRIYSTKQKKDATNIVLKYGNEVDYIVCSGGDGTLNEVTDGLMLLKKRPPCGYIPAGTVNDFASSLKISKNMINAAKIAVSGEPYPYDVGSLNDEFFTYVAGFGAFTDVSYETTQASKNTLGKVAYVLEGVKRLPSLKSYIMSVEYDNNQIKDEFIFGMITNSNSVGGFKGLNGKNVKLDDGLFEVALIKMPKNLIELQLIINALLMRELNNQYMYSFLTSEIHFHCEESVQWTIDGEFGGSLNDAVIKNHKQAIHYVRAKAAKLIENKNNNCHR